MKLHLSRQGILAGTLATLFARCRGQVAAGLRIQAAGITVGKGSQVCRGAALDDRGGSITIGERAWIGPGVTVLTGDPDLLGSSGAARTAPVTIGAGATIGARAIILPGVHIGAGALVGVGAIVTDDVPGAAIVAGAPARPIGRCREDGALEFAARLTSDPQIAGENSTQPASR